MNYELYHHIENEDQAREFLIDLFKGMYSKSRPEKLNKWAGNELSRLKEGFPALLYEIARDEILNHRKQWEEEFNRPYQIGWIEEENRFLKSLQPAETKE